MSNSWDQLLQLLIWILVRWQSTRWQITAPPTVMSMSAPVCVLIGIYVSISVFQWSGQCKCQLINANIAIDTNAFLTKILQWNILITLTCRFFHGCNSLYLLYILNIYVRKINNIMWLVTSSKLHFQVRISTEWGHHLWHFVYCCLCIIDIVHKTCTSSYLHAFNIFNERIDSQTLSTLL